MTTEEMMAEGTKNLQQSDTGSVQKSVSTEKKTPVSTDDKTTTSTDDTSSDNKDDKKDDKKDNTLIANLPKEQQEAVKKVFDKIKEDNKDADDKKLTDLLKKELDKKPDPKKKEEPKKTEESTPDINTLLSTHSKEKYKSIDELITQAEIKPDISKIVNDKTEGKYASLDDLYKATQVNPFASERIKKLNELEQKGVDITKILSFDSLGIDKLNPENREDALQLLRSKLRADEPDITERELTFELKKYDITGEEMEDSEKENINMRLTRTAKSVKRELEETRKNYELPKKESALPNTEELEKFKIKWQSNVSEALDNYTSEEFDLNGQGKVKYTIGESEIKELKEVMDNPNQFLNRYFKDGKTDMIKFRREIMFLLNQKKVSSVIFEQGKSAGAEEVVNSISNLSPTTTTAAPSGSAYDTPEKAAAKSVQEEGL